MEQFESTADIRNWSRERRRAGESIAFVPTMGALHAGHLSLVELAAGRADRVAVSIYVNPAQFGEGEDFERYPRDLERDRSRLEQVATDALWTPRTEEIYPSDFSTWVIEEGLSQVLEGAARPGHFRGVATIVTRLLTAVEPDLLVLGEKDAQQAALLRRVVRDLGFAVEVVTGPTVREADGLALSSRNAYLSPTQRKQAVCLSEALRRAAELVAGGEREATAVIAAMRARIEREPDARIDYLAVVDPESFQPLEHIGAVARICLAVFVDTIRLIDTQLLKREG